jgi:hypothetical protein
MVMSFAYLTSLRKEIGLEMKSLITEIDFNDDIPVNCDVRDVTILVSVRKMFYCTRPERTCDHV